MKKVLKKFNRTLSIMLAAAMVLTMTPQAAMPVFAEEVVADEPAASSVSGEETATPAETVVGETTETPDSTQKPEQIVEEGGEEEEEEITYVIETPDEPVEEPVEDPSEDDVVETTANPEPEVIAEEDEVISAGSSEMDALEKPTGTKILIRGIVKGGDDGKTDVLEDPLKTAEIQFTNNTASNDGTQVRADSDITFRVLLNDGQKMVAVKAGFAEKEDDLQEVSKASKTLSADADGIYTISKGDINKSDEVKYNALLAVQTEETKFTVKGSNIGTIEEKEGKEVFTASPSKDFAYSEADSIEFYLKGTKGTSYKVTATAKDSTKDGKESDPIDADDTKTIEGDESVYLHYSLNAFDLDGIKKNENQDITINVKTVAAPVISGTAVVYNPNDTDKYPAAMKIDNTGVKPADDDTTTKVFAEDGKFAPGNTVVFAIPEPAEASVWNKITADDITAELIGSDGKTVIDEPEVSESDIKKEKATVFAVGISENVDQDCTLKLTVTGQLKDTAKTITFTLNPPDSSDVVTIKSGSKTLAAGDAIKTEAETTYPVSITSKEGYQLEDISVQVKGKYAGADGGDYEGKAYTLENSDPDDKDYPRYAVNADIKLTGQATPEGEDKAKNWTATAVTVSIKVSEVEGADENKEVAFESESEYVSGHPYVFTVDTDETVKYQKTNETEGTAKIKEGTKYLSFTVKSKNKPEILVQANKNVPDSDDTEELLEVVSETSGEYKYRVAAKAFIDTKGKITITRPQKEILATFGSNAEVTYTNAEDTRDTEYALNNGMKAYVDVDAPLTFTVKRPYSNEAPISTVTYQVGGAEQQAQSDGEGGFFFEVKASENIAIKVTNAAEERLFVNGEEVDAAETMSDPLMVDYETAITAYLKNDKDQNVALLNATVYDGSSLAETVAKIDKDSNVVTLNIAKKERTSELTVTLLKKDRTAVTFKIASDKAVEEVTYAKEDGTPVSGNIEMSEDTTLRLRINTTDGSMGKVHAVVSDKADPEKITTDMINKYGVGTNITAKVEDGYLIISANPTEKTVDSAGTVLLYADGDTETILKGSPLSVKVNEPIIKRTTTTAAFKSADARKITISIDVPAELRNENLNDDDDREKLYYKIKVTAPTLPAAAPEGFTGDWKATKDSITTLCKTEHIVYVKNIDGGYTIPVIGEDADGVKLDGFKINVTPVQKVAEKEVTGKACDTITAGTMGTVYTDTLKLKADAKELITGQDKDVSVAIPDFAAISEYRTVDAEIIDSATGLYDERWYDDDGYKSFIANWDAVNGKVTVNAAHATAWDNAQGLYKNLAVKVTAYTEAGDYGVSGIQKLKVVNGIENISLSVQPEIMKVDAKKAVTVKTAVTFNSEKSTASWAKKTTPKSKVVEYSLRNVGAGVKGYVDVNPKSGQITVSKDFVPSEKADNTFDVYVEAKDYTGNTAYDWASVTVTTQDSAKGELAIFEAGTTKDGRVDWSHAKKVTQGTAASLEVKQTSNQYRLAMLKPTAPAKTTYDLSTSAKDFVDLYGWTIKYANKNASLSPCSNNYCGLYAYGIGVNKLGKITFTLTAKSNSKNKAELRNINFVLENTDLYVGLTQYKDSTFCQQSEPTVVYNDSKTIEVKGNTTNYYRVNLYKKVGENKFTAFALSDGVISVKNGKKVTPVPASSYKAPGYVMATGTTGKKATVISVKSKSAGKTISITINNPTAEALQGTAPKIALTDKKTRIPAGSEKTVGLTVTAAKKGEVLPENTYVMLSADHTKKTKAKVDNVFNGYLDRPIPISKTGVSTGTFSVKMSDESQAEGYTLIAVLGTLKDGVFTQTHKEARVTLKAVKGNINIKATGKYTLNPYGISSQKLVVSGGDYDVWFENDYIEQTIKINKKDVTFNNYAQNIIQKETGKPNEFNKYFLVDYDEDGNVGVIMINPTLSLDDMKNFESKDFLKKNGTGYITLTNGQKVVDIKLTVAINGREKMKLNATAASVLAGKDVITDVQILNGKTPVALYGYDVDGTSFKKYYDEATKENTDEYREEQERRANGIIRVKAADAAKGKDLLTTLRVLPAGLADVYSRVDDPLKDYGIDITNVSITVNDDKANKVTLATADKKWKVENSDWAATAERTGWATERSYTFSSRLNVACVTKEKDSGQEIKVRTTTPYVTFKSDKYNASGKQTLEIFLDKAELDKAIQAEPKKVNYGKTVKVDAVFSYPDKADAAKGLLKEDKVTFNITLPAKEAFGTAGELTAAVEAILTTELQEMADVKTSQYEEKIGDWLRDEKRYYDENDVANDVAADLKAYLLNMSKGTAAVIKVSGENKANVYTYTLYVADKTYIIETIGQASINDVIEQLTGYLNITDAKKAADLGIAFKPVTTDETLTQNLYKVLEGKKVLTNNITLSARVDTNLLKAPTTDAVNGTGDFYATVTITDRNHEPGSSSMTTRSIYYQFPVLTASSELTGVDKAKGLKKMLETTDTDEKDKPAVTGMTKLDYLFSESYQEVPTGIGENGQTISKDMKDALQNRINVYAKELIEENPYLSVKEITGFECEYDSTSNNGWNVEFTITYTDESGEEPEDISVELTDTNKLKVTKAKVARLQTPAELQTAAEAAFAAQRMLLDKVDSADAARDAVKAIITSTDVCLNPNYDKDNTLIVTAIADSFVAPDATNKTNGQVTVTVDYDGAKASAVDVATYTFVVLYDNELSGKEPVDPDDPDGAQKDKLADADLYKGLIEAALSEERLNKITQDAWAEFAKTAGNDWDAFIATTFSEDDGTLGDTITKTVEKSLKGHKDVALKASGVVLGTCGDMPTKAENSKIVITSVTVEKTDAEGTKSDIAVEVGEITLKYNEKFQSWEDYVAAVKADLTSTTPVIDFDGSFYDNGKITATTVDAVITAIETRAKSGKLATNLQWTQDAAKDKIVVAKVTDDQDHNTTYEEPTLVKSVKLTIDGGTPDYIDVRIKTLTQTDLISGAKFTVINNPISGDKDGSEIGKEVEITAGAGTDGEASVKGTNFNLKVQKELTSNANNYVDVDAKDITWGDIKVVANNGSESALPEGLASKVKITNGVLFVSNDAYAAEDTILKLTATIDGKPSEPNKNVATAYVKLKLTKSANITLKAGTDDKKAEVTGTTMTFEAPKTGSTEITFTAEVAGNHIATAGASAVKATIAKPADIASDVTFVDNTSDQTKLVMTIASTVQENKTVTLNVTGEPATAKTVTLTIVPNSSIATNDLSFSKEATDAEWTDPVTTGENKHNGVLTIKNTIDTPVKVPINGVAGRTWDTATSQVTDKDGKKVDVVSVKKDTAEDGTVSYYLEVANTVPEIQAEFKPEAGNTTDKAVDATTWTLTMISTADPSKGQVAVTKTLLFDIVVKKTIVSVDITATATTDKGNLEKVDKINQLTMPPTGDAEVNMTAELKGAHVAGDSEVTWKIISKNSKSRATINAEGVLTIPQGEGVIDNTITVQATSKSKNEDGNPVSGTYKIKVKPAE